MVAALGVFFGYPIQFFVMIKILWPPLKRNLAIAQQYPIASQVILRFVFVLLTSKCKINTIESLIISNM